MATAVALLRENGLAEKIWFDDSRNCLRTSLSGERRDFSDTDELVLLQLCQTDYAVPKMARSHIREAVDYYGSLNRRDEHREFFQSLSWDGKRRLEMIATHGLGAEDTDYGCQWGRILFNQLAARVSWPGCQADMVLVAEGDQGSGKTSVARIIGGDGYGELHSKVGSKDCLLELQGKFLVELADLASLKGRDADEVKAFITRKIDRYRPPYGRSVIERPRRCVILGTTNLYEYLADATGARRFLPLKCGKINLEWFEAHREQLLAEAWHRVTVYGEDWWRIDDRDAERERDARFQEDVWHDRICGWLDARNKQQVTIAELLLEALDVDHGHQSRREQMRVADVLRRMGWTKRRHGESRSWTWFRPQ